MNIHKIKIAKEFSKEPFGRYPEDGKSNGTKFREDFLIKSLEKYEVIEINFDDAEGYGSSFLDEAFGGLVRHHKFKAKELKNRLILISTDDPSIVDEVWGYIDGK